LIYSPEISDFDKILTKDIGFDQIADLDQIFIFHKCFDLFS